MYVAGEQVLYIREDRLVYVVLDIGNEKIMVNSGSGYPSFYLFVDEVRKLTKLERLLYE